MNAFRYGLFGVGRIGCIHGRLVKGQGARIAAIGDENPDAIAAARARLGEPDAPAHADAGEMSAAGGLDGVIIASHTSDHARHALPFVEAGIPVYVEKPLAADLPGAFDFVAGVGTGRTLIQAGLQRRYDPALVHAKQVIEEGLIGAVREIRSVLRDRVPSPPSFASGGIFPDIGIHVADEAVWLLDEHPDTIRAQVHWAKESGINTGEGGNTAFVTFTTASGTIGRLDLSRTHASGYNNETYVIGTRGTLHVGRFSGYPGPIPVEVWTEGGLLHPRSRTFGMATMPGEDAEFLPRFHDAYGGAHRAFREAVESGRPFAVTQNEALDAQVFAEAADRSARTGGDPVRFRRSDHLGEYRRLCADAGLLA